MAELTAAMVTLRIVYMQKLQLSKVKFFTLSNYNTVQSSKQRQTTKSKVFLRWFGEPKINCRTNIVLLQYCWLKQNKLVNIYLFSMKKRSKMFGDRHRKVPYLHKNFKKISLKTDQNRNDSHSSLINKLETNLCRSHKL